MRGLWLALGMAAGACAAAERNLADLTLTELMDEPVTSVSKKETRLSDSATAITVITQDDLRRLGITSIPEALRLVPGFDVARIDASHWAVSSRGFNQQYSSMLLVLVDGRSVYTPTFGGVYWDSQDVALADLDRIEVIRGPGATLWGANAVNGVVNIITKHAKETQGALLAAAFGTEDQPSLDARYGGTLGADTHYRTYAKYFERDGLTGTGAVKSGDWSSVRTGFRGDWEPSDAQLVTLQGDYYSLETETTRRVVTLTPPFARTVSADRATHGFNLLGRWTQKRSDISHLSVQAYFDSYSRYEESRDTLDLELEHRFVAGERHDIVWGTGLRRTEDDLHLAPDVVTAPARRNLNLYTLFVQDEIALLPDRLRITLGTKLEHNDFTGLEVQPNLRALWTPADGHTVWASASRAVSTPARVFHDTLLPSYAFQLPQGPATEVVLAPNGRLGSQKVDAYEVGYRSRPTDRVSADLTAFYNAYSDVHALVNGQPQFQFAPVPHVVVPLTWSASLDGRSYGAEVSVNYKPLDAWRITATYAWIRVHAGIENAFGSGTPEQQFGLRSYASLTQKLELNANLLRVGAIDSVAGPQLVIGIPSYVRLDAGLVYHATSTFEIGAWGQNLLDRRHAEIVSQDSGAVYQIPRSVLARVTKRF